MCCLTNSRMISRIVTAWGRVAGGLGPATLYARTRNSIFSPVGRSRMITEVLSVRPSNAGIHSSAKQEERHKCYKAREEVFYVWV